MAILFGTTADGENLPVQVNEFGQLVAKGLQGDKGDQGDVGPEGPAGNGEFSSGTFTPVLISSSSSGAGSLTYDIQDGYWYLNGPVLTVSWYIKTNTVTLTDTSGYAEVGGLPPEISFATPSLTTYYNTSDLVYLQSEAKGRADAGRVIYKPERNSFRQLGRYNLSEQTLLWADLSFLDGPKNTSAGSFTGLVSGSVPSVRIDLDDLM